MLYEPPPQYHYYSIEERVLVTDLDRIKKAFSAFNKSISLDERYIEPLAKGTTHGAFLVTVKGLPYVIKLFESSRPKSTLLKQFMHYQKAFELGVGPYIWHFDIQEQALIMEYIAPSEPNILEAISMLRIFHSPLENEPFATIYKRIEAMRSFECDQMPWMESACHRLEVIEKAIIPLYTLCHFDFHKDNFVSTDAKTYLIDFDNADFGHPFYDIAKFALREEGMRADEILQVYLQRVPTLEERTQLSLMIEVARLSSATNRMLRFLKGGNIKLYKQASELLHLFLENTLNFEDKAC